MASVDGNKICVVFRTPKYTRDLYEAEAAPFNV